MTNQKYLTNCKSLYICIYCRTHLANHDELVSRSFQGMNGRAYLFNSVINITCGPAVQRELITGSHAVADIYCANCKTTLGWKYEKAYEENQRYKEGKYIIELAHVIRDNRYLELDKGELLFSNGSRSIEKCTKSRPSSRNHPNLYHWQEPSRGGSLSSPTSSTPSTTSPSSLGCWSTLNASPRNQVGEGEDEELMFPFYDEFCASYSSYQGSMSSSHHNRMRRSLYSDSTPFDWKFAARGDMNRSLSNDCSSSSSSNRDGSSDLDIEQDIDGLSERHRSDSRGSSTRNIESETQFDFEVDRIDRDYPHEMHNLQIGPQDGIDVKSGNGPSSSYTKANKQTRRASYASLECDEEEFFDCYSDHDILNA